MTKALAYELLALDPDEKTRSEDVPSLLHALLSYSALWHSPTMNESSFSISDGETTLHVGQVQSSLADSAALEAVLGRAFIVSFSGIFDNIEALREPITRFLKDHGFDSLYVLKDQVSEHIACQLYPYLYRIENQLRGYLIKFMCTQIGPKWWERTVPSNVEEKVKMRRRNERVFGKHVENSAYLIDFDDLGRIVYQQCSGFVTREDILKKVAGLEETAEAIKAFKKELQTNYEKFFRESFAERGFKEKWREFEELRNRIAHSNLFTAEDLERGKQLARGIEELISAADDKTRELVISEREREAMEEAVAERVYSWQKDITETQFLSELNKQEERFSRSGGFVGVSLLLRRLTNLGYTHSSAKEMTNKLEGEGKVEIYKVDNPDSDFATSAIRLSSDISHIDPSGDPC